jgi:hypothetical protein
VAKGLQSERRQIEAEEAKLKERRNRLIQLERADLMKRLEKSPLAKMPTDQLDRFLTSVKTLGMPEVLKRLS